MKLLKKFLPVKLVKIIFAVSLLFVFSGCRQYSTNTSSANADGPVKRELPQNTYDIRKPPQKYTGSGQQVMTFLELDLGITTFKMKHKGKGRFAVFLMDKDGDIVNQIANVMPIKEIPGSRFHLFGLENRQKKSKAEEKADFEDYKTIAITKADLYFLRIVADSDWEIKVE